MAYSCLRVRVCACLCVRVQSDIHRQTARHRMKVGKVYERSPPPKWVQWAYCALLLQELETALATFVQAVYCKHNRLSMCACALALQVEKREREREREMCVCVYGGGSGHTRCHGGTHRARLLPLGEVQATRGATKAHTEPDSSPNNMQWARTTQPA